MNSPDRRDVLFAFSSLAVAAKALGAPGLIVPAVAQAIPSAGAPVTGGGTLGPARAIPFDSATATATANGGDRRVMMHGTLATGERIELHQSMQTPGTPPPAFHVVKHSELILIREGTLKYAHEVDGKIVEETAGPGGVFYVAYGTNHSVSNIGTTPARYFVVQIGGDA